MQQLQFSPISEKEEQSIDALSFMRFKELHSNDENIPLSQLSLNNIKDNAPLKQRPNCIFITNFYLKFGCTNLVEKFDKVAKKRLSYSFQLFKQFILFSSQQESFQIGYKHIKHQLSEGVDKIESTFGAECKITLGKAFENIRVCSRKRKMYYDSGNLTQFVGAAKIYQKNKMRHFFNGLQSCSNNLGKTVNKSIHQRRDQNCPKHSKFVTQTHQDQEQLDSITNFEVADSSVPKKCKDFYKKARKKGYSNHFEDTQSYYSKNRSILGNQNTPLRKFLDPQPETKRKVNEFQLTSKNIFSQFYKNPQTETCNTQNIIIVHSSRPSRKPDRQIRVPVTGDDVNIIELQSNGNKRKQKSKRTQKKFTDFNLDLSQILKNSTKNHYEFSDRERKSSVEGSFEQSSHHECQGCKYCSYIKEMEAFRIKCLEKREQSQNISNTDKLVADKSL